MQPFQCCLPTLALTALTQSFTATSTSQTRCRADLFPPRPHLQADLEAKFAQKIADALEELRLQLQTEHACALQVPPGHAHALAPGPAVMP